jgi:predicted Fe-Mo cluster-binding NifX family protein
MKLAISQWQNRVSPVFDVAGELLIFDVKGNRVLGRQKARLRHSDIYARAKEISGLGVRWLVCGAISSSLESALIQADIRVTGFACGDVDDVLKAWQSGRLEERRFCMPGCYRNKNKIHKLNVDATERKKRGATPLRARRRVGRNHYNPGVQ